MARPKFRSRSAVSRYSRTRLPRSTRPYQKSFNINKGYKPPVIPRGLALKKHHFKQVYHPTTANLTTDANLSYTFTGTGAAGSGTLLGPATGSVSPAGYFSLKFTAADLPQFSSFAGIFDAYRINKVVVKLVPTINNYNQPGNTAGNAAAAPQWMQTVIDYDDATLLTTEASLLEYESYKQSRPNALHKRAITPAIAVEAYKTSGTTIGFQQKRKQWIDAAYGDVEHYGLKGLINGPAVMADQIQGQWKVFVTMYISFKQTR